MIVKHGDRQFEAGRLVADNGRYRQYLCVEIGADKEKECLLQIATATNGNGQLDRAAYFLQELERRAREVEKEFKKVRTDPKVMLNYGLGFPKLVDSFVCQEQGGRRINILAFRRVDQVGQMIPLSSVIKSNLMIDRRTSVWILGKLLKLLTFSHSEGIAVGRLDADNILLQPNQHYVVLFDWSEGSQYPEKVPAEIACQEITQAAISVMAALYYDPESGKFPDDPDDPDDRYVKHLMTLAKGQEHRADQAHQEFYKLVDTIWERRFYPFTTRPKF